MIQGETLALSQRAPVVSGHPCLNCHTQQVVAWERSQHAWANRLYNQVDDGAAFAKEQTLLDGPFVTTVRYAAGAPRVFWSAPGGDPIRYTPEAVIGVTPLRQYLLPAPGGRLQTLDIAYDPRTNEWFDSQVDGRTPQDWGHWTGRGMNWNSQCAFCHMTGFRKNYKPQADTYQSTWVAMGIECAQCHGDLTVHAAKGGPVPIAQRITTNQYLDGCYTCHSRREELTGQYMPGESYHDHFRAALADQAHLFEPDGQVKDEDFEFSSFSMSRMFHMGVTCLDCHDPHSGKHRLPIENNALCLSCHLAPGQRNAKVIDPATHSHHKPGTAGDRCIDCHMPLHTYMVRDQRRDHYFGIPDPQLNKEEGIPDACTSCHANKGVDWSIQAVQQWYGDKMDRPQRTRARALARLRKGEVEVLPEIIRLAHAEEIVSWRAALVASLGPWADRAEVKDLLSQMLADPDALVRSSAVRALSNAPDTYGLIKPLRMDRSRLVRIDAARATTNAREYQQPSYGELTQYLLNSADQPVGALRYSEKAMAEDKPEEARQWAEKAVAWDPSSAAAHGWLGRIFTLAGKTEAAEKVLLRACALETNSAEHAYTLALLYGQTGRPGEAAARLRDAVRLDPGFGRAWYNLGLALAQLNDTSGALEALERAETLMPESVDPPYARATVNLRLQRRDEARAAAQRAATLDPQHALTKELLRRLE